MKIEQYLKESSDLRTKCLKIWKDLSDLQRDVPAQFKKQLVAITNEFDKLMDFMTGDK